jgi:hypothetical protein
LFTKILTNSALKVAAPLLPHLTSDLNLIWVAHVTTCRANRSDTPCAKVALHSTSWTLWGRPPCNCGGNPTASRTITTRAALVYLLRHFGIWPTKPNWGYCLLLSAWARGTGYEMQILSTWSTHLCISRGCTHFGHVLSWALGGIDVWLDLSDQSRCPHCCRVCRIIGWQGFHDHLNQC